VVSRVGLAGVVAVFAAGIWLVATVKLRWFPEKQPSPIDMTLEYLNQRRIVLAALELPRC